MQLILLSYTGGISEGTAGAYPAGTGQVTWFQQGLEN